MHFNPSTPLYLSDESAWRIEQLPEALQRLQDAGRPVVLFVHGRGNEPKKSLRGGTLTEGRAVHKIESDYNAKVLMFNWDSAFPPFQFLDRDRPLSHTQAGAEALGKVLEALRAHQAAHAGGPKPSLLVHSMGSVVLQKTVLSGLWPSGGSLFSNVLFSEPDADDIGHKVWLKPLAEQEKVWLTLNRDDKVLGRSTDARRAGAHALGLGIGVAGTEPLAPQATYVDIGRIGPLGEKDEDHEVFVKARMAGQQHVIAFFTSVMTGGTPVLDPTNSEPPSREVVYRLKP